jgi:hypothetical protein
VTLNPRAQALVEAGRGALRPTAADRERIHAALRSRLGDAAFLGAGEASTPAVSVPKPWRAIVSTVAVGLGVAGTALYFGLREPARPAAAASVTPTSAAIASPNRASEEPSSAPMPRSPATVEPAASVSRRAPERFAPDRLAQEVAILSRAASELHAGQAASALKAIDEHQSKFPNGLLTEERRAARVQALCALGRRAEADAELSRLTRAAPQSPHVARARQFCAATQRSR